MAYKSFECARNKRGPDTQTARTSQFKCYVLEKP
jgi:hypothetical protein